MFYLQLICEVLNLRISICVVLNTVNDSLLGKTFTNIHKNKVLTNISELVQYMLCKHHNFRVLLKLAANLWERSIPLMVCRCYGFIGYMRLAIKEHTGTSLLLKLSFIVRDNVCLYLSRDVRKPVFGVSDQVRHKPTCTVTEAG